VGDLKVLYRTSPGETEENHRKTVHPKYSLLSAMKHRLFTSFTKGKR
jgi:hypothetical protein